MTIPKILVTTTQTLEGWVIESYLGPVVSHIVAGTGFFSDFAAGLSDIFGGRSQSYQRQLSAINLEVISLLKSKAAVMGANMIIGLHIDHDEISGKGKQMFMVTAYGTAARGSQKTQPIKEKEHISVITSETMNIELRKKDVIAKFNKLPLNVTEEDWNLATDYQIHEIAHSVLLSLQYALTNNPNDEGIFARRKKFFLGLPSSLSVPVLYDLTILKINNLIHTFVAEVIHDGDLFDFEGISTILRCDNFELQKWALRLIYSEKPFYTAEDLKLFSNLIDTIKSKFGIRAKYIEEKALLSSSVKKKWICECSQKNETAQEYCENCSRDIYGFGRGQLTSASSIQIIENKMLVLREHLQ
ncbi:MAG: YbjQ family protein [bacterium]